MLKIIIKEKDDTEAVALILIKNGYTVSMQKELFPDTHYLLIVKSNNK